MNSERQSIPMALTNTLNTVEAILLSGTMKVANHMALYQPQFHYLPSELLVVAISKRIWGIEYNTVGLETFTNMKSSRVSRADRIR